MDVSQMAKRQDEQIIREGEKHMENDKDSKQRENVDELKELVTNILKEVSKFHPNYPVYGYDYVDGKLVSVIREQHEYL